MQKTINVSLRHADEHWEAYGINVPVYGYGKSRYEALNDIREAFNVYFDENGHDFEINEFQERRVYKGNNAQCDIWVRTLCDHDSYKLLKRREVVDKIKSQLEENPEYLQTFKNGCSSFGDVIATVCFEDDMLADLVEQVGDGDRIYVCMPTPHGLYWNCIFTDEAEDFPESAVNMLDLGLGDAATVGEFMRKTTQLNTAPKNYLVSA